MKNLLDNEVIPITFAPVKEKLFLQMSSNDPKYQAILASAQKRFLKFGFKKTSVEEIARDSKVGKATIYKYFKSKEDLFAELVRTRSRALLEDIREGVENAKTPEEKVRKLLSTRLAHVAAFHDITNLSEENLFELLPRAQAVRSDCFRQEVALLEEILVEGIASSGFYVKHPYRCAWTMLSALKGVELTMLQMGPDSDLLDSADELIELFCRGIRCKDK